MANRLSIDDPRRRPFRPQGGGFVTRAQADFGGGAGAIGGRTRQLLSGGGIHETRGIPSEPGDVFRPDGGAMQRKIGVMMPTQPGGGAPGSTRAALLGGGGDLREQALAGSQIALTKLTGLKPGQKSARERALAQLRSPQLTNDQRTERGRKHQLELARIPGQAAMDRQKLAGQQAGERLDQSLEAVDARAAADRESREKLANRARELADAKDKVVRGEANAREQRLVQDSLRTRQATLATRLANLREVVPEEQDQEMINLFSEMLAETSIDLGIAEGAVAGAELGAEAGAAFATRLENDPLDTNQDGTVTQDERQANIDKANQIMATFNGLDDDQKAAQANNPKVIRAQEIQKRVRAIEAAEAKAIVG